MKLTVFAVFLSMYKNKMQSMRRCHTVETFDSDFENKMQLLLIFRGAGCFCACSRNLAAHFILNLMLLGSRSPCRSHICSFAFDSSVFSLQGSVDDTSHEKKKPVALFSAFLSINNPILVLTSESET